MTTFKTNKFEVSITLTKKQESEFENLKDEVYNTIIETLKEQLGESFYESSV